MSALVDVQGVQSRTFGERGVARYLTELATALERWFPESVERYLLNPDLPVEAASERMLSPESYRLPRVVASLLRSTPVTRVPFLRVSATCTSRMMRSPLSYAFPTRNDQA